jgi:asparagine synthase (glutamine-hydrolysing)
MTAVLAHRGPDDEGILENGAFQLGMRRLSVIDIAGGHQPMTNEAGTVAVVFNGEIYNHGPLRQQLRARGHAFRTRSDTEVLVHGYEEWGDELPVHLRGMFAFAILDSPKERLLIVRDHLGVKPLYYSASGGRFWFASEIKSLLADSRVSRDIDLLALSQYLSLLYVPEPRTIFGDIQVLRPGHRAVVESGGFRTEPYWVPPLEPAARGRGAAEAVAATFEDSVAVMLEADVPLGLFLSGGLDSAAILAMMAKHSSGAVKTFSIGFGAAEHRWDELVEARALADHFGAEHHELHVDPDIVKTLPQVIGHVDQPFANPTAAIVYQLSAAARRHVTVALSGTGGDEMFAGYPRYRGMAVYNAYAGLPAGLRRRLSVAAEQHLSDATDGRTTANRLRRFLAGGALPFDDCYIHLLKATDDDRKAALLSPAVRDSLAGGDEFGFLRQALAGGRRRRLDRLMLADLVGYLPGNQLVYGDRMSMAASLELRVPFVDQEIVKLASSITLGQKLRHLDTKGLFRKAMEPHLPADVLKRPKRGLNLPIALWFRHDMAPWLRQRLAREELDKHGLFEGAGIERLLSEHEGGRRDNSLSLWALAVFQTWYDMYVDHESPSPPPARSGEAKPLHRT